MLLLAFDALGDTVAAGPSSCVMTQTFHDSDIVRKEEHDTSCDVAFTKRNRSDSHQSALPCQQLTGGYQAPHPETELGTAD